MLNTNPDPVGYFNILSSVWLGAAVGFLAATTNLWFLVAAIVPLGIAALAAKNLYSLGWLRGAQKESDRAKVFLEHLIDELGKKSQANVSEHLKELEIESDSRDTEGD